MTNRLDATQKDPYVRAFPELRRFWESAAEGVFLLPRCRACSQVHWHPRAQCPFCHGPELEWIEASGRAKLYSHAVVRRPEGPYVLAWVELDEGPILMTNVVDCDVASVRIDMPLQVAFRQTSQGRMAPVFRPARQSNDSR